jgi:hypothetical protein
MIFEVLTAVMMTDSVLFLSSNLSIDTSVSEKNTVFLFSPEEGDSTYISPKRWYLPTISKDGDCVFMKRWYLSTSPDAVATQKTDIDKDCCFLFSR